MADELESAIARQRDADFGMIENRLQLVQQTLGFTLARLALLDHALERFGEVADFTAIARPAVVRPRVAPAPPLLA